MQRSEPGSQKHVFPVAKVIEIVASSAKGFDDAVKTALDEAKKTVHGISGLEVTSFNVKVSEEKPVEYRVACKVAFAVER